MSLKDYLSQNQASMKEWLKKRDRIIAQKIFEPSRVVPHPPYF